MGKASHKLPLRLVYIGKTLDLFFYLCSHLIEALTYLCQFRISIFRYLDLIVSLCHTAGSIFQFGKRGHDFSQTEKKKGSGKKKEKNCQNTCLAKKGLILCKNIGNVFVGDNLIIHFCNRLCRNIGKKQKRFPINFTDNRIVTVRIRVVKSFWDSSHLFLNFSVIKFIDGSVV